MNFCSIEDAWGDNKISDQFQKHTDKPCSNINNLDCKKNIEKFTDTNINIITCDDFIGHINNCKHCYNKLFYKFNVPQKNELINNLHNIINNNKDTIVLILIGMFILLFFKLVNNITSK